MHRRWRRETGSTSMCPISRHFLNSPSARQRARAERDEKRSHHNYGLLAERETDRPRPWLPLLHEFAVVYIVDVRRNVVGSERRAAARNLYGRGQLVPNRTLVIPECTNAHNHRRRFGCREHGEQLRLWRHQPERGSPSRHPALRTWKMRCLWLGSWRGACFSASISRQPSQSGRGARAFAIT